MAFTTWTALRDAMRDDLATGAWRIKTYEVGDSRTEYTGLQEFLAALDYVDVRATAETKPFYGRTYARNGGRG